MCRAAGLGSMAGELASSSLQGLTELRAGLAIERGLGIFQDHFTTFGKGGQLLRAVWFLRLR